MLNLNIFAKQFFLCRLKTKSYIYIPTSHPSIIQSFKYGANRSEVKNKIFREAEKQCWKWNKTSQMRRYKLHFVVRSINYLLKWIPLWDTMATARWYSQGNRFAWMYKYCWTRACKKLWVMLGQEDEGEKFIVRRAPGESVARTDGWTDGGGSSAHCECLLLQNGRRTITNNYSLLSKQHHWVWRDMANCFRLLQTRCSFRLGGRDAVCAPQCGSNILLQQLEYILLDRLVWEQKNRFGHLGGSICQERYGYAWFILSCSVVICELM